MDLTWGNPATVRNIGDGAVSTHECGIFVNGAGISGTDDACPRADGFTELSYLHLHKLLTCANTTG